ncbi:ATP-binding protein [Pirellulaceae bacterium]|jgi:two-component system, LuxR family, sensor kinase FixL|nr:ATP-binding protein [Pirellulaceae bacterium]MDB4793807.1 ATP-binding protein [Pirellulaceae bacterium]
MDKDRQLRIQESRLETILKIVTDAIITTNHAGAIDTFNPATEQLFGYVPADLMGNNVLMLLPDPESSKINASDSRNTNLGHHVFRTGGVATCQRKDKSLFEAQVTVCDFQLDGQTYSNLLIRNIGNRQAEKNLSMLNAALETRFRQKFDELRKAQAELVRREKLATLGKVAGNIAHEIRNPLNAAKMSAYFLLNASNPTQEKVEEHLNRIDRQITIIDSVVTTLTDVVRLPEVKLSPQALRALVDAALIAVPLTSDITVQMELAEGLPKVLVDQQQISLAIQNLIRNAADAMDHQGILKIEGKQFQETVKLSISDDGCGIEAKHLEVIFEPLYSTKAKGMGMGLALTKIIVEKNKGEIMAESTPGKGSCFHIILRAES